MIWDVMKDQPLTLFYESLDKIRTGHYAFLKDKSQIDYLLTTDCESFTVADEVFNNAGLGFVMNRDSVYLKDFSHR